MKKIKPKMFTFRIKDDGMLMAVKSDSVTSIWQMKEEESDDIRTYVDTSDGDSIDTTETSDDLRKLVEVFNSLH